MFTQMELSDFLMSDMAYHETGLDDASKIENMRTTENEASEDEMDDKVHTYIDVDEWKYIRDFLASRSGW